MGAACLLAAVVSVGAMFSMMGGKNAKLMAEYQAAQDVMSKAGTEYVRGIPVVKVFQQTVYSFRAFKQAIEDYSAKAEHYQGDVCRVPQAINLTATEGAFVFLVPVALLLAPGALRDGSFAGFLTDFAFYAVFSAIVSTALAKIMFAASGMMLASTALGRIAQVMNVPTLEVSADSLSQDARVSTLLVLSGLCKSQSDARKQIEQNAVSLDDVKVTDPAAQISALQLKEDGILLKKGKKGFCRIKLV
jgi:ABC-type multidrug transport system fused ATPase/permease subunit